MKNNPANQIDFYKADHRRQYPNGTQIVFSNLTARKSRVSGVNEIVFFGLQYFIKEYLMKRWNEDFFKQPKEKVVNDYKRRIETSLGKDAITFEHIEALHDLGYLPLEIKALPEGSIVGMRCPCLVMFNTKAEFFWVTNYFETILSCVIWGGITSATTAYQYKRLLTEFADKTVGNRDFVQWQGHDFSFRGMFGFEAACISGAAHLLSFTGTDTIPAIDFHEQYYGANSEKELIGASVPATEHSVMCMGTKDDEIGTFKRLISEIYPAGIVSIVSDTWDFWKVITEYVPQLKDLILARNGKVVIRPDSGDPVKIICGESFPEFKTMEQAESFYEQNLKEKNIFKLEGVYFKVKIHSGKEFLVDAYQRTPEDKGAIECLWETFGGTITDKGYKLLDGHIGLIYGDSITIDRCKQICQLLMDKGFCSFNVVLGIGSYTYQYVTRDTFGFAVKATYGEVNGESREIFKNPKTDDGTKNSAKGLIAVYRSENDSSFQLHDRMTWIEVNNCELKTVFRNGTMFHEQTLSEIRDRLKI